MIDGTLFGEAVLATLSLTAAVLVLCRLCRPSSELYIAEHLCKNTAMADLLGIPDEKINEQRLYRALDKVLYHKDALQIFLKHRLGSLFRLALVPEPATLGLLALGGLAVLRRRRAN